MTDKTRTFLLTVRQTLIMLLCALEEYLDIPAEKRYQAKSKQR